MSERQRHSGFDVRPRTAGEILDDAFRLYLADAPLLLALTALTAVPALGGLVVLLTRPEPTGPGRWLVPALVAFWLPLLGLGAGACQEVLHRRAEGRAVGLGSALAAALRRGLGHLTASALVLAAAAPGLWLAGWSLRKLLTEEFSIVAFILALVGLVWLGTIRWLTTAVHALLTGRDAGWPEAVGDGVRESQRQAGRAFPVLAAEFAMLIFAVLNIHILTHVGLWVAEHLAGFDLAFTGAVLVPSNPVYLLALVLLAGLLLAPYGETTGYLLHVDARARSEGLDLRYRVLRRFPPHDGKRLAVLLLAPGGLLFTHGPAQAALQLATVQHARAEVQAVRKEAAATTPYPGGARWFPRLRTVVEQLEREAGSRRERLRWLRDALDGFSQRNQQGALHVLEGLDRRLALLEESLTPPPETADRRALTREEIRKLLPAPRQADPEKPGERKEKKPPEPKPVRRDTEVELPESRAQRGPAVVPPAPSGGFDTRVWLILAAVVAVAALVALLRSRQQQSAAPPAPPPTETVPTAPSLETILTQPGRYTAGGLWKAANELADAGRFREAVHTLYLSVLVLLHRASLIRYERTRTNGEYVQQLRGRAALHGPFAELTTRFEGQWYGDRPSRVADYEACLTLAQRLSESVPG